MGEGATSGDPVDAMSLAEYFGEHWGARFLEGLRQGETPVGEACSYCHETIQEGDRGLWRPHIRAIGQPPSIEPMHAECDFRLAMGSVGHLMKQCSCYGGTEEDPPAMSDREAAVASWNVYYTLRGVAP